jgi:hypothetical protein
MEPEELFESVTTSELRGRKRQRTAVPNDRGARSVSQSASRSERNRRDADDAPASASPRAARRSGGGAEPDRPRFADNESLGEPGAALVAAPTDHDAPRHAHSRLVGERCFACRYAKHKDAAFDAVGAWNCDDVRDAYSDMMRLISDNYGHSISNEELVNMVWEFYEREIRALADYGEWSKECIFQHIVYHANSEETQLNECNKIIYAQIQALRHRTWVENSADGTVEPHHKNLTLLDRYIKSLGEGIVRSRARQGQK